MVRIAAPIVFRSNSLYNNRSNALLIFGHCKVDRKANLDRSRKINDECSKRSTEKDESILHTSRYRSRSEEHTSELQSRLHLVCRLLLEKKKNKTTRN